MTDQMHFMDCPNCGKRVRTNASRCHHCGQAPAVAVQRARDLEQMADEDPEGSEEHHSASGGGYLASADDFDYEEFLEDEFGERPRSVARPWWWYVAWVVLGVFAMSIAIDAIALLMGA